LSARRGAPGRATARRTVHGTFAWRTPLGASARRTADTDDGSPAPGLPHAGSCYTLPHLERRGVADAGRAASVGPVRVGAVDLGTNSTRLLVADVEDARVTEVVRRLAITRLGEGVGQGFGLRPAAVGRVHAVLDGYAREASELGTARVLAVATSAVRDAADGRAFLQGLEERYGWATRLLTGEEEAETTLRGVTSDRLLARGTLLVDIGGGSTELAVGGPAGVSFARSLQAGCVRLTERFLRTDPPTAVELEAAGAHVRALLPAVACSSAVGVAGTVTTVAAIELGLDPYDPVRVHGHRIARATVARVLAELSALPLFERERVVGLEPARAPVIVGGLVVLREVMGRYGLPELEASERDLLHGTALAAAGP